MLCARYTAFLCSYGFVPSINVATGNLVPAISAKLNKPCGVAPDGLGNLYVADSYNHAIRFIAGGSPSGIISTVAGALGASAFSGT
jgi:hypothetical protein